MVYGKKWGEDLSRLNKIELLKLEKDGLDVLQDIERYAKLGYGAIPPDDLERLKWVGVYEQRPKDGHFMLRVRVPSGFLNSRQVRILAAIGHIYGRNLVDVTTRQAVQFHWLRVEHLPDVLRRLQAVGLFSIEACGDCPRNVMGNPLAGIDPNELMDTTELVRQVQDYFILNRDFSNLPRKFKISISANIYNTGHAEINDLSFTPAVKMINGEEVTGFHVWVGGGLSTLPQMAQQLDIFVLPEKVLDVAIGVATIFRDYGYRQYRNRSRLKFLVADWGIKKFEAKLLEFTGELPSRGEDRIIGWNGGYFVGVYPQKQPGLYYVGLAIPGGRMKAFELAELARLADEYGNGSLRSCNSQNLIITHVPEEKLKGLLQEPVLKRISPIPNTFTGYAVSCAGNEFCSKAVVETKGRMKTITEYLDAHVKLDTPIRLHMSGCPNSCGQTQIADIGLQGTVIKTPKGPQDAFEISLGGTLGPGTTFAGKLKGRVLGKDTVQVIAELIRVYQEIRLKGETFHDCVQRVGLAPFQARYEELLGSGLHKCVG
jgi:ferredoxin-nitrite reductase